MMRISLPLLLCLILLQGCVFLDSSKLSIHLSTNHPETISLEINGYTFHFSPEDESERPDSDGDSQNLSSYLVAKGGSGSVEFDGEKLTYSQIHADAYRIEFRGHTFEITMKPSPALQMDGKPLPIDKHTEFTISPDGEVTPVEAQSSEEAAVP